MNPASPHRLAFLSTRVLASLALVGSGACGDAPRRPLGALCDDDAQCASGLCLESMCLDPAGDEDRDGLSNGLEAELGTNPHAADSDGDGRLDPAELAPNLAPIDSDGDGRHDALESAIADSDGDCRFDQDDPTEDPAPDLTGVCPAVGVCAATGPQAPHGPPGPIVRCENGVHICDFSAVPDHEWHESRCDLLDNDCDGATDEGCALLAHYPFDGTGAELGRDTSGHAHDGVVTGVIPARDRFGHYGGAAHFEARGDVVRVRDAADLWSAPVTITFWVRPAAGFDPLGLFVAGPSAAGPTPVRSVWLEAATASPVAPASVGADRCLVESNPGGSELQTFAAPACLVSERWTFVALVRTGEGWSVFVNAHHVQTVAAPAVPLPTDAGTLALLIGRATDGGLQFRGELDDLRVTAGPLDEAALGALFREGGWGDVGSHANPARACDHVASGGGSAGSARYWIDPDGDGLGAPFEAWCDMTTAGGGWTLVWSYGFADDADFTAVANAVVPIPGWPAPQANVAVSEQAPHAPGDAGAIAFRAWSAIGQDVLVTSNVNDVLVCEPDRGSLVEALAGSVHCTNVGPGATRVAGGGAACAGIAPTELRWEATGPTLATAGGAFYAWDGATDAAWPVHDPCGVGAANQASGIAAPGGNVYLRHAARPGATEGRDCADAGVGEGVAVIDPRAPPGPVPSDGPTRLIAACSALERGGWTQLVRGVLPALADGKRREYLLTPSGDGAGWYRTPGTTAPWRWEAYADLPGLWLYQDAATGALGAVDCAASDAGTLAGRAWGLGCAEIGAPATGMFDEVAGTTTLCQDPPGAFAGEACVNDVHVWTRVVTCEPDAGSLVGDGHLAHVLAGAGDADADAGACWRLDVDATTRAGLAADAQEFPPGGAPPTLHATGGGVYTLPSIAQIRQAHLTLVAGRHYQLRLTARAAAAREVFVELADAAGVLTRVAVPVTTDWGTASVDLKVARTTIDAELRVQFGRSSAADVWLAEVVLADL